MQSFQWLSESRRRRVRDPHATSGSDNRFHRPLSRSDIPAANPGMLEILGLCLQVFPCQKCTVCWQGYSHCHYFGQPNRGFTNSRELRL